MEDAIVEWDSYRNMKFFVLFFAAFLIVSDAQCHRAAVVAEVNNQIITEKDLDYRVRMTLLTNNLPITEDNIGEARATVLKAMIDEAVKLSIGKKYDLMPGAQELADMFQHISDSQKDDRGTLKEKLTKHKIPERIFLSHLKAEIAWRNYLRGRFGAQIHISEGDILEAKEALAKGEIIPGLSDQINQATFSFVQAVFIFPENASEAEKERIRKIAHTVSQNAKSPRGLSSLASKWGKMARVQSHNTLPQSRIPQPIVEILKKMKEREVSPPLEAEFGLLMFGLEKIKAPEATASDNEIRSLLTEQKIQKMSQREFGNVYREAHIHLKDPGITTKE